MRLDHLLSKEHFYRFGGQRARTPATVRCWFAHGWNVDYSALGGSPASSVLHLVCVERVLVGGRVSGTLLGPEGTAARSVSSGADPSELRPCWVGVVGGWSLLENCTVDASICGQVFKGARWMPWH